MSNVSCAVCIVVLHTLPVSKGFGHMPSFEASRLGFVLRLSVSIGLSASHVSHPKMLNHVRFKPDRHCFSRAVMNAIDFKHSIVLSS